MASSCHGRFLSSSLLGVLITIVALVQNSHALPAAANSGFLPEHEHNAVLVESINAVEHGGGPAACSKGGAQSFECLKSSVFNIVDHVLSQDQITIMEGVQITKNAVSDTSVRKGAPRSSDRLSRVINFFRDHTLQVDIRGQDVARALGQMRGLSWSDWDLEEEEDDDNDVVEAEARGEQKKKKKAVKKMMGPLMAMAGLKMMILGKIFLATIALIAGKALVIGKVALVLSAIIGLKKLLGSGNDKHVTYEVVSHPQHSSSHVVSHESADHHGGGGGGGGYGGDIGGGGYGGGGGSSGHGGWGRSMVGAQDIAYRAHSPNLKQ